MPLCTSGDDVVRYIVDGSTHPLYYIEVPTYAVILLLPLLRPRGRRGSVPPANKNQPKNRNPFVQQLAGASPKASYVQPDLDISTPVLELVYPTYISIHTCPQDPVPSQILPQNHHFAPPPLPPPNQSPYFCIILSLCILCAGRNAVRLSLVIPSPRHATYQAQQFLPSFNSFLVAHHVADSDNIPGLPGPLWIHDYKFCYCSVELIDS